MSDPSLSTLNPENKKSRASKVIALAILSPAVLALSGCNSNCDSNYSTPQTSDDCGTGRTSNSGGARGGGGYVGGHSSGTKSGGFGGIGRFFSGGG